MSPYIVLEKKTFIKKGNNVILMAADVSLKSKQAENMDLSVLSFDLELMYDFLLAFKLHFLMPMQRVSGDSGFSKSFKVYVAISNAKCKGFSCSGF